MNTDNLIERVRSVATSPFLRILTSVVVIVVVFQVMFALWTSDFLESGDVERRAGLTQIVILARNSIEHVVGDVRGRRITREEGISQARDIVRRMIYEDQYGSNYIFMSAYDGTMLVQPFEPAKEMTSQWDLQDVNGVYIIRELVRAARANPSGGFVSYYYYLPNTTEPQEKLAFVIGIPELGCYIGTGMYMQQAHRVQHLILQKARYWSLVFIVLLVIPVILSLREVIARNRVLVREGEERKKAQEMLSLSEQNFRTVFNNVNDSIIVHTVEGRLLAVNERMLEMYRMDRDQALSSGIQDITADFANQPERMADIWARVWAGETLIFDWRAKRPADGSVFDVEVSLRKSVWSGSSAIFAVVRDISARKAAEKAIRENAHFLQTIIDSIPAPIFYKDMNGIYRGCNRAFEEYLGLPRSRVIGASVYDAFTPELADIYYEMDNRLFNDGGVQVYESSMQFADGSLHEVMFNKALFTDAEGASAGIVGVIFDLTERKHAEDALRESESRLQDIVYSMADMIYEVDENYSITYCSHQVQNLLGYSADEMIGASPLDFVAADNKDLIKDMLLAVFQMMEPFADLETWNVRKDGSRVCFLSSGVPIFDREARFRGYRGVNKDITGRKQADEIIRKSEKQLRTIFEAADNIAFIIAEADLGNPVIIEFSAGAEKMFGYQREEIKGKPPFILNSPEDLPKYPVAFELMKKGKPGFNDEVMMVRKNGERFPALFSNHPLLDDNGVLYGILGVCIDISDRKRAEEIIRASEERYRSIFENTLVGVYRSSLAGRFIVANSAFSRMAGYDSPEDLIESVADIGSQFYVHPEERERTIAIVKEWGYIDIELQVRRKDGSVIWVENYMRLSHDENGSIVFDGVAIDIDRKKRAEEELRRSEEKFNKAFYSNPIAMTITTFEDGKIVDVNREFEKLTDLKRNDLINRTMIDLSLWKDIELRKRIVRTVMDEGSVFNVEVDLSNPAGDIRTYLWSAEQILIDNRPHVLASAHDITERKRTEDRLTVSLREKETLLKEIHHRVKNNLQVIISLLSLQSRKTKVPEVIAGLDDSQNRIRAMALVHERLYQSSDLSHVDFGNYLKSMAHELFRTYSAAAHGIAFRAEAEEIFIGIDLAIPCGLMVSELISNSLKHAFHEGSDESREITLALRKSGNMIEIDVGDNGVGLPGSVDLGNTPSLGLVLVPQLVRQIKGEVWIDRTSGTRFHISFPAGG